MPQANDYSWYPNGSNLDSTAYGPANWNVPLPGPGSTVSPGGGHSIDWTKIGAAGVPIAASLFAGDRGSINPSIGDITSSAKNQQQQGQRLFDAGVAATKPSLDYFKQLLSGNPSDLMQATAPDRKRVIDQYDTARRSAGQFTPRGGGQASASMEARAAEASDLATLGASARNNAATALASIGTQQENAGLATEQAGINAIAQTLGPQFQQNQSDSQSTLQTVASIAAIAALFL